MATQRRPSPGTKQKTTARTPAASTRSVQRGGPAAPKDNKNLIIGGAVGGGILFIAVLAFALSGDKEKVSKKKEADAPKTEAPKGKPVDVAGARRACDEGLGIIESCRDLMEKQNLTDAEAYQLKTKLTQGKTLIQDGMSVLSDAGVSSDAKYREALKIARMKLGELK